MFIVAPINSSPFDLSTGTLSPVNADSSMDELPSIITPSVGIRSPGLTTIKSPSTICSTGISVSLNSFDINFNLEMPASTLLLFSLLIFISPPSFIKGLITRAVLGFRSSNFLTAFEAFSFVFVSSSLPVRMMVIIIAAVSK